MTPRGSTTSLACGVGVAEGVNLGEGVGAGAGARIWRALPSLASSATQSDSTEVFDQSTRTHLACASSSWMTLANDLLGLMLRSHHTDQPCCSRALTNGWIRPASRLA